MRYLEVYECENEELDEQGIDICELSTEVDEIAKSGGINLLSNKSLVGMLTLDDYTPVGGLWVSNATDSFSFDIAIDRDYQGRHLSTHLINAALDEYNMQDEMYQGDNHLPMDVDVINPSLAQNLIKNYNFQIDRRIGPDRVIMSQRLEENLSLLQIYKTLLK